jgi:hypothetical protein
MASWRYCASRLPDAAATPSCLPDHLAQVGQVTGRER